MKDYYIRKATETKNYKEYQIMYGNRLCDAIMISQKNRQNRQKGGRSYGFKRKTIRRRKRT